jgi:hypothetical protein
LETCEQYVFRKATCVFVSHREQKLRFVKVEDEIIM